MLVSSQAAMSAVGLESLDDAALVMEEGGGEHTSTPAMPTIAQSCA